MTGIELKYSEAVDGSREYRLSISRQSLELVNLDMVEHQQLTVHDEDCPISDTLWELGNVVRRIERQLNRTMLQNGDNDELQLTYEYRGEEENQLEAVNVFDKKDNADPD